MSNMYFNIYRDDIIKLVRSVIIKFNETAIQINDRLYHFDGYVTDADAPETWKYYMHLAGDYHPTDEMMYVKSADTLETIEFTKANLAIHRATAREYYPGSTLYKSLVRQFPNQADLITGILYPIDIQVAINAKDGQILYHDPKYVEPQEDTFIFDLQDWVHAFTIRWYNQQFNLTDELFHAGFIGNLYGAMVNAIMNLRLAKAKTNKAHSYHIREYLASHEHLDDFIPYLDTFQMLWLYRNINFLQRHAGSKDTFQRLVKNLLTHRGIPLLEYTLNQNSTNMLRDNLAHVEMIKHDVNFNIVQEGLESVPVSTILTREEPLARDNPLVKFDHEKAIMQDMGYAQSSVLPTRVYDSEVIDRSVSNVRSFQHVLLNEWLHLASSDKYRAFVQIPNPKTGELMTMSVKDAFIVTMYCWMKSRDYLSEFIPKFVAYDVLRDRSPTFAELRKMSPKRIISDKLITAIMDITPPMRDYISTEQFYIDCHEMHQRYLRQWDLYSFQEHMVGRAYCEQIVRMHYMNRMCSLVEGNVTWDDYFFQQGFNITDMSVSEMEQLCMDAINIATGADLVKIITLGEIQRELLRLMGRLSSYIAQYLRNVEFTKFHVLGIVMPRLGDIGVHAEDTHIVPIVNINVREMNTRGTSLITIPGVTVGPNINWSYAQYGRYHIDPCVYVTDLSYRQRSYPLPVCNIGIGRVSISAPPHAPTDGDLGIYQNSTDADWPKFENK